MISEQRTASSSPEHPSLRAHGRSVLSGTSKSSRDYPDDIATSRSEGASASETRRLRGKRSVSVTPEISDEIVRAVRAMNESLKQNRIQREHSESGPNALHLAGQPKDIVNSEHDHNKLPGGRSALYAPLRQHSSQKAVSLPSSPHEFRNESPERIGIPRVNEDMVLTWNRVLDSPMFQNKPLLPFEEWNIDFSEITVGTRIGIGFFGEVFRGIWNGTEVAIKVFLEQDLTAENMEDFCNEISILRCGHSPHFITCHYFPFVMIYIHLN